MSRQVRAIARPMVRSMAYALTEGVGAAIIAWLLAGGFWNDSGVWKDTSVWED